MGKGRLNVPLKVLLYYMKIKIVFGNSVNCRNSLFTLVFSMIVLKQLTVLIHIASLPSDAILLWPVDTVVGRFPSSLVDRKFWVFARVHLSASMLWPSKCYIFLGREWQNKSASDSFSICVPFCIIDIVVKSYWCNTEIGLRKVKQSKSLRCC